MSSISLNSTSFISSSRRSQASPLFLCCSLFCVVCSVQVPAECFRRCNTAHSAARARRAHTCSHTNNERHTDPNRGRERRGKRETRASVDVNQGCFIVSLCFVCASVCVSVRCSVMCCFVKAQSLGFVNVSIMWLSDLSSSCSLCATRFAFVKAVRFLSFSPCNCRVLIASPSFLSRCSQFCAFGLSGHNALPCEVR